MEISTVKEALGLPEDATDTDVLDRISALRSVAGEKFEAEDSDLVLIRKGEHDQCCINANGTVTVTLAEPIKFSPTITVEEITLRRPKMRDFKKAEEMAKTGGLARGAAMIHLLSEPSQAMKVIDELDMDDANVLGAVVGFLREKRRPTGQ